MLQYLVAHLRRPVDNAIAGIVGKIVVGLPLLIAGIFLISALNNHLHTLWGPVWANLAVAGIFLVVAAIAAITIAAKRDRKPQTASASASETTGHKSVNDETMGQPVQKLMQGLTNMSPQDRDLALTVATTALPIILPKLLKLSARNVKTIGIAAAAYYVVTRAARLRSRSGIGRK